MLSNLAVSIVCYNSNPYLVACTIRSLDIAAGNAKRSGVLDRLKLILVDNGEERRKSLEDILEKREIHCHHINDISLMSGHGNIGYGRGHNLAIQRNHFDYHLVLNPDVLLAEDSLIEGLVFLNQNPGLGLLAPSAVDHEGNRLYLCKRFPTVFDLLLRGFAPVWFKRIFVNKLEHYELRDVIRDKVVWDIPIVSGCFMLLRTKVLIEINGFSPVFFLYFEDFDLSLRVSKVARIAFVPSVRITHFGGHASKKGWRHIMMFLGSAVSFFNRHGWRWFKA